MYVAVKDLVIDGRRFGAGERVEGVDPDRLANGLRIGSIMEEGGDRKARGPEAEKRGKRASAEE